MPGGMSISIPIRGRGTVGILDLLTLLANWGAVRVRQTPKRRNAECHEPKPRMRLLRSQPTQSPLSYLKETFTFAR